jgi:hypothetical protein
VTEGPWKTSVAQDAARSTVLRTIFCNPRVSVDQGIDTNIGWASEPFNFRGWATCIGGGSSSDVLVSQLLS